MEGQELSKNSQAESWINGRIKEIKEVADSGNPSAIWINESDWPQGGFSKTYLQKLKGIVPIPDRTEQISDLLVRNVAVKEVLDRLGAKEWKLNAYFSGWDTDDRHVYAETNIPNVYAHQLLWRGSGWGGSLVFVSGNLKEEKINSISNIRELKMAWEEKYKKIEEALGGNSQQTILIEDFEGIGSSEGMFAEVFKYIPKWDGWDVPLSKIEYKENPPSTARIIELLLEYGLNPQPQRSIVKDAETGSQELRWLYYKTKLPNVFLHRAYCRFKKDNASILPSTVLKSQKFVTVNCGEEQFKLE